jgi:nicotinamidase-related amidase
VPDALGPTVHDLWGLFMKADMQPMDKTTFSGCGSDAFMQKIDQLKPKTAIVCGIESHVCVFQTAIDLLLHGLDVHVVADAVTSRTNENKQIGLHRMAKEGAVITSTEMLLFELLRDSKHPKFRELAKLIK